MAGLGGKNWGFQEEVTSSDVNGFLADQVVMRFGGTANRDAGFGGAGEPTLAEGMVSYLDDANRLDFYDGSAWKPVSQVLQVVSTTKSDTFSTTSTSYTDVTGMSVSITPSSTNSKILVLGDYAIACFQPGGTTYFYSQLVRNSTAIYLGDTAGNRSRVHYGGANKNDVGRTSLVFLDSPATTSATTYKLQVKKKDFTGTIFLNRSETSDTDVDTSFRVASSITVLEIAG